MSYDNMNEPTATTAEPETDEDRAHRLVSERAEMLRTMPVADMTARQVLDARNPYPTDGWQSPSSVRYRELEARKEEVQDEIAAARDRARKGLAPDPVWTSGAVANDEMRKLERALEAEPDNKQAKERLKRAHARRATRKPAADAEVDPRLEAWRKIVWDRVGRFLKELPDRHSFPETATAENVATLEKVLVDALAAARSIREQLELENGA